MVMFKECKKQIVPKQIATVTLERTRKIGRPSKRRRDEVKVVLNIMGTKNRHTMARDRRELGKILLEGKFRKRLHRLRRKRGRIIE
jgi:hypothetical protein